MKNFFVVILLFCAVLVSAQQNECYSSRKTQGVEMFKKGNYDLAKRYFNFANSCAFISNEAKTEIKQWLQLCDDAIAGKEVQIPENLETFTDAEKVPAVIEQPQKPVINKAAERAKREAAERAQREAIARGEVIEQTNTIVEQQRNQFAEMMQKADSCFNASDYATAEVNYQIAAKTAQQAGNQNDVQTALKKIDCCQQLSQANKLIDSGKFDDARTKLMLVKALGCIDVKSVQALIDKCNAEISQSNEIFNNNVIAPLTNDMVLVKGGIFMMGCQDNCREGETPVHQVVLKNFYLSKHEITQDQWEAIMDDNPSYLKNENFPVTNISYSDIQDFIVKLNAASGLEFRLPTESEWEYAARGGEKSNHTIYAGSNAAPYVAWFAEDSENEMHPVGQLIPNELDIYDMSGNAAEWCSDWYADYTKEFHLYPVGANEGKERVVRGGGFDDSIDFLRVTFRFAATPNTKSQKIGFRLASDGFE
ncbi:MAG: formylglycine-generating enzyme family protein [Paludibacter sp.]|nr:formylglycine-generating enzyme family protein [Paludibacter sp.]